ncbi:MAG: hypothetical protein M1812_008283, partial [Candelaria pacifica]
MWTDHLLKKLKLIIRQELATAVKLNCLDYNQCKYIVMILDHSIFSANLNNKTFAQLRTPVSTSNTETITATFTAQNNTSHSVSGIQNSFFCEPITELEKEHCCKENLCLY